MFGPAKPRRLDQPIAISLEDLVPWDHFYRHLEATLDLSFIRDWTRELYAERGRPSIDPVVFFKLQLVMFFEGIRSERQLMHVVADRLSLRWYLGYDLTEPLPDHSSLTRIFRWKLRPRQVTGVTKYGTTENIAAIERERIHAYMPLSAVGQRAGMFGELDFAYDAAADSYRCPAGEALRFLSHCQSTQRRIYAAPAAACAACALRPQCTTAKRGRRISRHRDEAYLDRVRAYHATEPYAKAMRKRQVWVEPLFAEAKVWHGLRRFRLRGLENVNGEALLIAAGQNLKHLLSWRGWGRRPFPSGAAGIVLPAFLPLPDLAP
jgi:hypothetical protein